MQNGEPAIGTTAPRVPHATISSYEGVVPKTVNWRTLGGGSERRASASPDARSASKSKTWEEER